MLYKESTINGGSVSCMVSCSPSSKHPNETIESSSKNFLFLERESTDIFLPTSKKCCKEEILCDSLHLLSALQVSNIRTDVFGKSTNHSGCRQARVIPCDAFPTNILPFS